VANSGSSVCRPRSENPKQRQRKPNIMLDYHAFKYALQLKTYGIVNLLCKTKVAKY
jgi:hypothetical protein